MIELTKVQLQASLNNLLAQESGLTTALEIDIKQFDVLTKTVFK